MVGPLFSYWNKTPGVTILQGNMMINHHKKWLRHDLRNPKIMVDFHGKRLKNRCCLAALLVGGLEHGFYMLLWLSICWEYQYPIWVSYFSRWYNVAPPVISWFRFAPVTIVISTINHSYWSYLHQLSYLGGLTLYHQPIFFAALSRDFRALVRALVL